MILAETISLPIGWIISIIGSLAGVVTLLARILWATMQARLAQYQEQLDDAEQRLERQENVIAGLQGEVARLSVGCGHPECEWRKSRII
jgi:uncharacterized protein HemX